MSDEDFVRRSWRLRRDEPITIVPGHVSRVLFERFDLRALMRVAREHDAVLYDVLLSLYRDALEDRGSATGTEEDTQPELAPKSRWLSTTEAADILHITDRAVRKAIADKRLPATQVAGRHRISREDLEHYRQTRTA